MLFVRNDLERGSHAPSISRPTAKDVKGQIRQIRNDLAPLDAAK
jgi:hypothetical protein